MHTVRRERCGKAQEDFLHNYPWVCIRDGPLENLWGGEVQKKYSHKGKLNEIHSCTPINPKKNSCYGLKKIHTKNLITKKKFLRLENAPPPISFLMVRPLVILIFI